MNYYEAKQRTDGRWDYTRNNHGVGYCREYCEIDLGVVHISESEQEEYRATADKHHTDGHETEEEARECYREYLLDHRLMLNRKMENEQRKCQVCEEWTQGFAEIDQRLFTLCDQHNNREAVETLFEAPHIAWSSW